MRFTRDLGRVCLVLAAPLLLLAPARAAAVDRFKVIVHPSNSTGSVTRAQLAAIFLGKSGRWPDGAVAQPVDRIEGAPVRQAFSREALGRSASAVKTYWVQRVFSGRGLPPPERASEAEILEYVRTHPAAVGYAESPTDEVKVLRVEP